MTWGDGAARAKRSRIVGREPYSIQSIQSIQRQIREQGWLPWVSIQWVGERARGTAYLEGMKNTMGSQCSKAREGPRPKTVIHKELRHTDRKRCSTSEGILRMALNSSIGVI